MKLVDFLLLQVPNGNASRSSELLNSLIASYSEPDRHYHNLKHIENGINTYLEISSVPFNTLDLFAWAYHDVVYDSTRNDNEQRSADRFHADSHILGFNPTDSDRVCDIIRSTEITREATGVVNDIDLSGLGSPAKMYNENRENIRKEYNWVDEETWKVGRSTVLKQLLGRTLYQTEAFRERFEKQAIRNIKRELKELETSE